MREIAERSCPESPSIGAICGISSSKSDFDAVMPVLLIGYTNSVAELHLAIASMVGT